MGNPVAASDSRTARWTLRIDARHFRDLRRFPHRLRVARDCGPPASAAADREAIPTPGQYRNGGNGRRWSNPLNPGRDPCRGYTGPCGERRDGGCRACPHARCSDCGRRRWSDRRLIPIDRVRYARSRRVHTTGGFGCAQCNFHRSAAAPDRQIDIITWCDGRKAARTVVSENRDAVDVSYDVTALENSIGRPATHDAEHHRLRTKFEIPRSVPRASADCAIALEVLDTEVVRSGRPCGARGSACNLCVDSCSRNER